jgi:hypothetical protein
MTMTMTGMARKAAERKHRLLTQQERNRRISEGLRLAWKRRNKDMSIDARVNYVVCNEDGSGELRLIDRPARPGETPGIKGQSVLRFKTAPEEVTALNGLDVWGGDDGLMLGEVEIAKRVGYISITFCDAETFKSAVAKYHKT